MLPRRYATIGRQLNEFKHLKPLCSCSIYRLEHISTNGSGKVVAKSDSARPQIAKGEHFNAIIAQLSRAPIPGRNIQRF
jgi:hypothetical protein